MNKSLDQLLKEATKDILSTESLAAITEAFNKQVESAVAEKISDAETIAEARQNDAIEKALESQDTDYAAKLEKLLEAIDNDHTLKVQKIVNRIDENHSVKLRTLAEKYNSNAKKEAEAFKKNLVEKVSRFLELRLTQAIPDAQLTEAVSNRRAQRIVDAIRSAVSLDEKFVTNEIRDALQDGKKRINESQKVVTDLQTQVKVLTEQGQKLRTSLLLEQKTSGLPKDKKDYVVKVLSGKSEKFITENLSHVVEMFEQNEREEVETLKESATSTTEKENVDQPVVTESVEDDGDPMVTQYLEGLTGPKD